MIQSDALNTKQCSIKQLQIISTRGGHVFNQVITEQPVNEVQKPSKPATPVVQPTTPEYDTLAKTVDLTGYTARVVTDNYNTRVTIFSDAQHHAQ